MIKFLILILVALIVFPIVLLVEKKLAFKKKLFFLVGGFIIALLGIIVQSTLSLYYSFLLMVALLFAGAVLITKRLENERLQEEEIHLFVPKSIQEAIEKPSESYTSSDLPASKAQPMINTQSTDWLKPAKKEDQ